MNDLTGMWEHNVENIPCAIDITDVLNQDHNWNAFTVALDGRYELSTNDIKELTQKDSPAFSLIYKLRCRGMTIREFVGFAERAQIYTILSILGVSVPVRIVQQPFPLRWKLTTGTTLTLQIKAAGSPQPLFQWFKDDQCIHSATTNVFELLSTSESDSGKYVCQVSQGDIVLQSNAVEVLVVAKRPLVIKEDPESYCLKPSGNALLRCEVWGGEGDVDYQWMRRGGEKLADSEHYSGSNTNELKIYNFQANCHRGNYYCLITRGDEVIRTQDAYIQENSSEALSALVPSREKYTASDKVALIMGAGDYISEDRLTAPKHDVETMARIFQSLDFKVVSLMDLNRTEMIAAIHEFKELVGQDVYCVFYFCGHGYEAAGQCFLIPPDAPHGYMAATRDTKPDYCLSADSILFNYLLPKRPRFCVMILDICRIKREGQPVKLQDAAANYLYCYSCLSGKAAYEQENSGILVRHLEKILHLPIGIEDVFKELRKQIAGDSVFKEQGKSPQSPEIRTCLHEPSRSFRDPIERKGYTNAYRIRQDQWQRAYALPSPVERVISFPGFDVEFQLQFHAKFSNSLTIFTSINDSGHFKKCKAWVTDCNAAEAQSTAYGNKSSLCNNNMQRLRNELKLMVTVQCTLHDDSVLKESCEFNLGWPLVSCLHLCKGAINDLRYRVAEEGEESCL